MTNVIPDNIDSNYQSTYVNNPIINVNNNSGGEIVDIPFLYDAKDINGNASYNLEHFAFRLIYDSSKINFVTFWHERNNIGGTDLDTLLLSLDTNFHNNIDSNGDTLIDIFNYTDTNTENNDDSITINNTVFTDSSSGKRDKVVILKFIKQFQNENGFPAEFISANIDDSPIKLITMRFETILPFSQTFIQVKPILINGEVSAIHNNYELR